MSDQSLLNMVTRIITARGKTISVVKLSSDADDSDKPWRASSEQVEAENIEASAMFLPATGHGMGHLIDRAELTPEISEVAVVIPPTTGEDFRDYHLIIENGVQKKVYKWWVVSPADTVIAFIAGIKK